MGKQCNRRGRPQRTCPADFDQVFAELGWEGTPAYFGTNPRVVHRWLIERGYDSLRNRRRNYVLGFRLSSVKHQARLV